MSDALEHEVKIIIDVVSNLRQAAREADLFNESIGNASQLDKFSKKVGDAADRLDSLAGAARQAANATEKVGGNTRGFDALKSRIQEVNDLYREHVRLAVSAGNTPMSASAFSAANGLSATDLNAFRRGNSADLLKDEAAEVRELGEAYKEQQRQAQKAADERADTAQRTAKEEQAALNQIAASHARNAEARRAADEANRQAQWRAAQDAKERAAQEARVTAELRHQSDMLRNADRARNTSSARAGSFMAQGSSGLSAADTTWARESTVRMAEARRGLAEYDAQLDRSIGTAQRWRSASEAAYHGVSGDLDRGTVGYKASTSALADLLRAEEAQINALPRMRYALYDVANASGVATAALVGLGSATLVASASYESAFTNVERTLEPGAASVGALRDQFMQLSREIPLAFSELAGIGTLGNQLGIEAQNLEGFTGTVARFSAVAGVTAEETAKSFGSMTEILGVLPTEYENLGSSIALVGRRSVATEQEILSLTREVGQQAYSAGFAADEVVGLAGALGELRLPPERSRGSLTTYFQTLNKAVAEGGPKLDAFARVVGVTAEELEKMVRGGEGAEIMRRFLTSLQDLDNVDTTKALDELGLAQLRVSDVFQRLSSNVDVFNNNLASGAEGWNDGTELARQYGMVLDDLDSKWQIFLSAIGEVAQAFGNQLAPAAKDVLDAATGLLHNLAAFAESPFGQWVIQVAAGVGTLAAALGALTTGFTLSMGALYAFRSALAFVGLETATTGIRGFIAGMVGLSTATGGAATALTVFKWALVATGIGAAVVLLGSLTGAFLTAGQAAEQSFNKFIGSTAGLADALNADRVAYIDALAAGNQELISSFQVLTPLAQENTAAHDDNARAVQNTATVLGLSPSAYGAANDAISTNTQYLGENTIAWVRNQLMQSEAFRQLAGSQDFTDYWVAIGANMEEVIRASASGGEEAVLDYFRRLENAARAGGARFQSAFNGVNQTLSAGWMSGRGDALFSTAAGSASGRSINDLKNALSGFNGQLALLGTTGTSATKDLGSGFDGAAEQADKLAKAIGNGGGGTGGVTKQVRTLVDYANDLSGVMKRAFDIRFGGQQALDQITSGWQSIANAARDAREAALEHQRTLASLGSDRSIRAYWLSISEMYGDEMRSQALRSELAEIDADIAKEKRELAKAQDKASMSLEGNSEASIENRAKILGMVSSYQDYLQALAASGMSQAALQAKSAQLRSEFIQQATQMGFSRAEVDKYAQAFNDMALIIQKVPRNITVTANTNPALQALAEFEAKARSMASNKYSGGTITVDDGGAKKQARLVELQARLLEMQKRYVISIDTKGLGASSGLLSQITALKNLINSGSYASGGYTGSGGKFDPAGIVHRGEFVFSKEATSFFGPGFLSQMHQAGKAGKGMTPVGLGAGSGIVELGPASIHAIVQGFMAAGGTYLDGKALAQSASNHFASNTRFGGN